MYPESCQISQMECFSKKVKGLPALFLQNAPSDMFEYACEMYSYFNTLLISIAEEGLKFHHKTAAPWDESREDIVKDFRFIYQLLCIHTK